MIFQPDKQQAKQREAVGLEALVPTAFSDWSVDETVMPVLPPQELAEKLRRTYDETLARTYVNGGGERVMLSIAYGGDQTGNLRVHRPESCYMGQGFQVEKIAEEEIELVGTTVPVKRLFARAGNRNEPITYWIRVGDDAVTGALGQRLVQLKYGLRGVVPDGLIFRVSSIGGDTRKAYALQDRFIIDLLAVLPADQKARLVGRASSGRRK